MSTTKILSSDFLGFNNNTGAVQLTSGTTAERPGSASNGEPGLSAVVPDVN